MTERKEPYMASFAEEDLLRMVPSNVFFSELPVDMGTFFESLIGKSGWMKMVIHND